MQIKYLEKNNFDEEIKDKRILVDFYADWCGPCRMLGEVLKESKANIECLKVNIDENNDLASKYGVMSIPTMIVFENGKEVKRNVGFVDEEELNNFIS